MEVSQTGEGPRDPKGYTRIIIGLCGSWLGTIRGCFEKLPYNLQRQEVFMTVPNVDCLKCRSDSITPRH